MECDRIIPTDVLDDLCSRFIINVPEEERKDLIRICFQIENAHWFYLDFYCKDFPPNRKPCGIKEFALQIFNHIPFLQGFSQNIDKIIEDWKDYKFCVPTFGAILLDEDLSHVLLVQSYCSRSSWGFPKGKVNKDEPPHQCAIREVYEETGFDISNLIDPNEYIEANVNDQVVRLYIITGVNKKEKFQPQTRYEIKAVNWFPLCEIPLNKKDSTSKLRIGNGTSAFFLVFPFLRKLRQWIFARNQRLAPTLRRPRHKSCGDIEYLRKRYGGSFDFNESVKILKNLKEQENKDVAKKSNSEENQFNISTNSKLSNKTVDNGMSKDGKPINKTEQGRSFSENGIVRNQIPNAQCSKAQNAYFKNEKTKVEKWTIDNQKYLEQTENLRKLFWLQVNQKSYSNISIEAREKDGSETAEIFHIENMIKKRDEANRKIENFELSEKDEDSTINTLKSNKLSRKKRLSKEHGIDTCRNIFSEKARYSKNDQEYGKESVLKKEFSNKCDMFTSIRHNDYVIRNIHSWINFKFNKQFIITSMSAALRKTKDN